MMSAANLDEIKKKYKFKEISVATWRDPSLSVHPARGGPDSPRFSPNAAYIPTYKANYDLTDDEGSESEGGDEVVEQVPTGPPLEDLSEDKTVIEPEPDLLPEHPNAAEEGLDVEDQIGDIDEGSFDPVESVIEAIMPVEDHLPTNDPAADATMDTLDKADQPPAIDDTDPFALDGGDDAPDADPFFPSDAGSDERRVSFAPGTPDPKPTPRKKKAAKGTKTKKKRIAVPIDSLPPDVMAMIDGAFEGLPPPPPPPPPPAPEPPGEDDVVPDKLPEGLEPFDHAAEQDVSALEEPSVDEPHPVISSDEPPVKTMDDSQPDPSIESVDEPALESQESEPPAEVVAEPPAVEDSPLDEAAREPITEATLPGEKVSKKKSSKSGKDKDKSKKKSSKIKSRDVSPPPTGLGIEIPPPPPPPPGLDLDENIDETQPLPSADHEVVDVIPAEDIQQANGETNDATNLEGEANHLEASGVEDVPKAAETESPSTKAADPDQAIESKEAPVVEADGEKSNVDVGNEPEDVDKSSELPGATTDQGDGKDTGMSESAPSPADSGVEFDDDGHESAKNGVEAEQSGSTEAAGDALDEVETSLPTEGEAKVEPTTSDESASTVQTEAASPSDPKEIEPQDEAAKEDTDVSEPQASESTPQFEDEPPKPTEDETKSSEPSSDVMQENELAESPAETPKEAAADENAAKLAESPTDAGDGSADGAAQQDEPKTEHGATEEVTTIYEPPTVESVSEEAKVDPFAFEVVDPADEAAGEEPQQESAKDIEPVSEAPPSPVLSKSDSHGSQKHKADHWERKHAENPLKEVFEDSKVFERSHGSSKDGKDELRIRNRHRKSRRMSSSGEDEGERRRRRAARREDEAARLAEEERRRAEDERRHHERRALRRAVTEDSAVRRDTDTARQRHRSRDSDRGEPRSTRPLKAALPFTLPAIPIPKALNLTSAESVHGTAVVRSHGGAYRPATKEATRATAPTSAPRDEPQQKEAPRETKSASPPSSGGEKTHHRHRHRRHRSDVERSSRSERDGDHRSRRPLLVEERSEPRPRSFLGFVKI